jgi:undecaprenyl-diphosphatase
MSRVQVPSIAHLMTSIQAILLGLVQGITEFFPVSSSTHLLLVKKMLGISQDEVMIFFDLFCHLGTLGASCVLLKAEIFRALTDRRSLLLLTFALLPLLPAYLLLKPYRTILAPFAPLFLIGTGALLWFGARKEPVPPPMDSRIKWRDVLWIGIAQGMALIPGISRCASTTSVARLCGWSWDTAIRFSFLLAIPAIVGGTMIEGAHMQMVQIPWFLCMLGGSASFVAGWGTLHLLFRQLSSKMMRIFAGYCIGIGALSWYLG